MPRRGYEIIIDPKMPRPWQRDPSSFKHPELLKWIKDNRAEILAAIFTMARSWIKAGKPAAKDLPVLGGFENWAKTIGGILAHAGITDFLGNLDALYDKSEVDDGWQAFLTAWYEIFKSGRVKVKDVVESLKDDKEFANCLPPDLDIEDKSLNRKLAWRLRKKEGVRYANGLFIERSGLNNNAVEWRTVLTPGYSLEGSFMEALKEDEAENEVIPIGRFNRKLKNKQRIFK